VLERRDAADLLKREEPFGSFRHHHVEQDQIRPLLPGEIEAVSPVARRHHRIP
jgi:hypothetical protein